MVVFLDDGVRATGPNGRDGAGLDERLGGRDAGRVLPERADLVGGEAAAPGVGVERLGGGVVIAHVVDADAVGDPGPAAGPGGHREAEAGPRRHVEIPAGEALRREVGEGRRVEAAAAGVLVGGLRRVHGAQGADGCRLVGGALRREHEGRADGGEDAEQRDHDQQLEEREAGVGTNAGGAHALP
jgi:hypothetical protein